MNWETKAMRGLMRAVIWGVVVALAAFGLGIDLTWRVIALLIISGLTDTAVETLLPREKRTA